MRKTNKFQFFFCPLLSMSYLKMKVKDDLKFRASFHLLDLMQPPQKKRAPSVALFTHSSAPEMTKRKEHLFDGKALEKSSTKSTWFST